MLNKLHSGLSDSAAGRESCYWINHIRYIRCLWTKTHLKRLCSNPLTKKLWPEALLNYTLFSPQEQCFSVCSVHWILQNMNTVLQQEMRIDHTLTESSVPSTWVTLWCGDSLQLSSQKYRTQKCPAVWGQVSDKSGVMEIGWKQSEFYMWGKEREVSTGIQREKGNLALSHGQEREGGGDGGRNWRWKSECEGQMDVFIVKLRIGTQDNVINHGMCHWKHSTYSSHWIIGWEH